MKEMFTRASSLGDPYWLTGCDVIGPTLPAYLVWYGFSLGGTGRLCKSQMTALPPKTHFPSNPEFWDLTAAAEPGREFIRQPEEPDAELVVLQRKEALIEFNDRD